VLRSREEESSTSATSTAQAKLLRQIEMLQTQHTIASQNWQRIEGSLQHRNDSLEKEKNDLTNKWEEEKKKVKDTVCPMKIITNSRLTLNVRYKLNLMISKEK
jgi:TATA element modulatory factor